MLLPSRNQIIFIKNSFCFTSTSALYLNETTRAIKIRFDTPLEIKRLYVFYKDGISRIHNTI